MQLYIFSFLVYIQVVVQFFSLFKILRIKKLTIKKLNQSYEIVIIKNVNSIIINILLHI